jgi:hypothetical protein
MDDLLDSCYIPDFLFGKKAKGAAGKNVYR